MKNITLTITEVEQAIAEFVQRKYGFFPKYISPNIEVQYGSWMEGDSNPSVDNTSLTSIEVSG